MPGEIFTLTGLPCAIVMFGGNTLTPSTVTVANVAFSSAPSPSRSD